LSFLFRDAKGQRFAVWIISFLAINKVNMIYDYSGAWNWSEFTSGLLNDRGIRVVTGLIINAEVFIPGPLA